jgi:hypothetical protein
MIFLFKGIYMLLITVLKNSYLKKISIFVELGITAFNKHQL